MITQDTLKQFRNDALKNRAAQVAMNAATKNGIEHAAIDPVALREHVHEYATQLNTGAMTEQKRSGRCWMFAALNAMRYHMMQQLNLETFEFSQAYPLFWDKLEKSNAFLSNILDTLDEPVGSRVLSFLLSNPLGDGGQFDMFAGLVEKYGVVPKYAMPETYSSENTGVMTKYLTKKLRQYAAQLREAHQQGETADSLNAKKGDMLNTIYRMLTISLGVPPEKVDLLVRDKEGKLIRDEGLTPTEFYRKYVGWDLSGYVSLINAPTQDKPFNRPYTVRFLSSVREARPVRYLNLPIKELKAAAIKQLNAGEPVWFGCDVGQELLRDQGIMDTATLRPDLLFDTDFPMTKAQKLDYGDSLMTHAMVLLGVHLDKETNPVRWRVENSWGKDSGKDGYYLMTDKWFDEYVYQVVINKKHLSAEHLAQLEGELTVLEPWDPMGSLA